MRNLIFIALMMMCTLGFGQHAPNSFYLKSGYGWYRMDGLRELQAQFLDQIGMPMSVTDDFPPYLIFELAYQHKFDQVFVGAFAGYKSTGARLHYADYSGEIFFNQELSQYSLGVLAGLNLTDADASSYAIPLSLFAGLNFTTLDLVSGQTIGDQSIKESLAFKATGISIQPQIGYWRYFTKFGIGLDAGYEFNIAGKLYFDEEQYLVNDDDEAIKAQWDGLRLKVGVSYNF